MKFLTKVLIALPLLSIAIGLPQKAIADLPKNWVLLASEANGDHYYLNSESVAHEQQTVSYSVLLWNSNEPSGVVSTIEMRANCQTGEVITGKVVTFARDGSIVSSSDSNRSGHFDEGSSGERVMEAACAATDQ